MELFGPDFEQYEEVQAELDRIAIAEAEREAEVTLVNANNRAPHSFPVNKSKAKKGKIVAKSTGFKFRLPISNHGIYRRASLRNQNVCRSSALVDVFPSLGNSELSDIYTKSSMLSWLLVTKGRQ